MKFILSFLFFACSFVSLLNVRAVYRDKGTKGVSVIPTFVFIATNLVEIIYFFRIGDYLSMLGAWAMLGANVSWLGLTLYYQFPSIQRNPA